MTDSITATGEAAPSVQGGASTALRVAVLDRDSGFIQVLNKRLERVGWEHRVLAGPGPAAAVISMRLSALAVDLAVLGPQAWGWLERLCGALPELGIVVCTGPSTVAQRVRGLRLGADDWITKPCHPEEVIARVQSVVRRRRSAQGRGECKPLLAGEVEIRSDRFEAFVRGASIDLTRREFELIELLGAAGARARRGHHLGAARPARPSSDRSFPPPGRRPAARDRARGRPAAGGRMRRARRARRGPGGRRSPLRAQDAPAGSCAGRSST